jgi:hypothetical protein
MLAIISLKMPFCEIVFFMENLFLAPELPVTAS